MNAVSNIDRDDERIDEGEMAGLVGVSARTLQSWRDPDRKVKPGAPMLPWLEIGGRIKYRRSDAAKFLAACVRHPGTKAV